MPYDKISELPDAVKTNVPKKGQQIYKEAYNSAWDQYDKPSEVANRPEKKPRIKLLGLRSRKNMRKRGQMGSQGFAVECPDTPIND